MDTLSCILDKEVNLHLYNPISIAGCNISHLLYIDDLLVVGEADHNTINSLQLSLDVLKQYTGLEVNKSKSSICFSMLNQGVPELLSILDIEMGSFPLKYLGFH